MIVAIAGMATEARLAARIGLAVRCGGGDQATTRALVAAATREGASMLVSLGIAGGLAPGLLPGTLIVANRVASLPGEAGDLPPPAFIRADLLDRAGARSGTVLAATRIVSSVADKAALFGATSAVAVDLETREVALSGLPYVVIRAIADPADRALPQAALVGLKPDGTANLPAVLRSLAADPRQLPGLIRVARDTRAALAALLRGLDVLGPALVGVNARDRVLNVP